MSTPATPDMDLTHRIVPLTGTVEAREAVSLAGKLLASEIHTDDEFRAFIQNRYVGARIHEAANQAAMLALGDRSNLTGRSPYGVKRGDWCFRPDKPNAGFLCITSRGTDILHWKEIPTIDALSPDPLDVGRWEPVTNGDPDDFQLISDASGDIVMGYVPPL